VAIVLTKVEALRYAEQVAGATGVIFHSNNSGATSLRFAELPDADSHFATHLIHDDIAIVERRRRVGTDVKSESLMVEDARFLCSPSG